MSYEWLPPYCQVCKIVGHVCGKGRYNTTRFVPANQQKKSSQIWRKKVVQSSLSTADKNMENIDNVDTHSVSTIIPENGTKGTST